MEMKILKSKELLELELNKNFKPSGTLGTHFIKRIDERLFVNNEGMLYEVPAYMQRVGYHKGEIFDLNETSECRFEEWRKAALKRLGGEYKTLSNRYAACSERNFRNFVERGEGDRILDAMTEINCEYEKIKSATFKKPTRPVENLARGESREYLIEMFKESGFSNRDAEIAADSTKHVAFRLENLLPKARLLKTDIEYESLLELSKANSNKEFDKKTDLLGIEGLNDLSYPRKISVVEFVMCFFEDND